MESKSNAVIALAVAKGLAAVIEEFKLPDREAMNVFSRAMTKVLAENMTNPEESLKRMVQKAEELGFAIGKE